MIDLVHRCVEYLLHYILTDIMHAMTYTVYELRSSPITMIPFYL